MSDLYHEFTGLLMKRYGKYDEEHHRFDRSSNSDIARELGYSDAQFSRLINGSATDGEYQRAIQNLQRILYIDKLESQLGGKVEGPTINPVLFYTVIFLFLVLLISYSISFFYDAEIEEQPELATSRDATLQWAFETSYIKPYMNLDDLPDNCNYPCYKYQGKWALDQSYKLPFFREQNGYHYLATDVNMYARCMSEDMDDGSKLEGYEYQRHEIWYDKRELPVDSFLMADGQLSEVYKQLRFAENDNFIRLAIVHTFFRNEFVLDSSIVRRSGKVIGRDVDIIDDLDLLRHFDEEMTAGLKSNLNRIISNRLEDFSKPVSCDQAAAPAEDFNEIKDGDLLSFLCQMTTNRVGLNYTKTYKLLDQYIKNTCRPTD